MVINDMDLYVYDSPTDMIGVVEKYISLIWADRYDECGDFELTVFYDAALRDLLQKDRYVSVDYSDRTAIIEKVEISHDEDGNANMIVTGRTVEIIMNRRIVLNKTEFKKDGDKKPNLQDAAKKLIDENIISPADSKRTIPGFIFQVNNDSNITRLTLEDETYDKDVIFDIIAGMAQDKHIGFKVLVNESGQFIFSFYKGVDRSNEILFSPYYDNLNNSSYFSSVEEFKNIMFVSKNDTEFITVPLEENNEPTGLARRETHESASSLKENKEGELSDDELKTKARKKLKLEHKVQTGFEGDIIPDILYQYRTHYNVGDKVQLEDEYGNAEVVYVSEVVITFDENGLSIIPTFKEIDWDEEEV